MYEQDFIDWFWSRVDKSDGPDACWYFGRNYYTYATATYKGKGYGGVHRIAYQLTYGPIEQGLVARHQCDNPPCCNPAHILPGTDKENSRDMVSRGRWTNGRTRRH